MNLLECFVLSFEAIAQAMLMVGVGIFLTRSDFITAAGKKTLANVALNALVPCLLFSKVLACPDTLRLLQNSWILLILPLMVVAVGLCVGQAVAIVTRSPVDFKKACIGMVTFSNSNSLAVVLLELLGPPMLKAGIITQDPTTSLSVYLIFYPMLEWTAGAYLFGLFDEKKQERQEMRDTELGEAEHSEERSDMRARCIALCSGFRKVISSGLQPPVIAVLTGLVVSLVPEVHGLFVASHPGAEPPLGFVYTVIYNIGQAMPPISMFVLAGSLSQGADRKAIPMATNLGILFGKMLLMPSIMACAVFVLARTVGRTNSSSDWLVALVVSCTPSANKIMIMVELSGQNKGGVTLSIFTQYLAAPVILTGMLGVFAHLLQSEWYLPPH